MTSFIVVVGVSNCSFTSQGKVMERGKSDVLKMLQRAMGKENTKNKSIDWFF